MTDEEMRNAHYKLCVIDGDLLAYRSASAVEKMWYQWKRKGEDVSEPFNKAKDAKAFKEDAEGFFGEDTSDWERASWKVVGERERAIDVYEGYIKQIKSVVKADKYDVYIEGEGNHRIDVAKQKEYKGERKGLIKPEHLDAVRSYMLQSGAKEALGIETDDVCAIIKARGWRYNTEAPATVTVTIDKDDRGVYGVSYNNFEDEFLYTSEYEANLWLFTQSLVGDSIDSIIGLPDVPKELRERYGVGKRKGVGLKTAEKILEGSEGIQEMYARVLECYQDYYGDSHTFTDWKGDEYTWNAEQMMDEQTELVYMMREKGLHWHDFKKANNLGTIHGQL